MILNNLSGGNKYEEELATWGRFPNDILEEILSRLPVRVLVQFSSVSKPWLSLISNPWFAKVHYNRATTNEGRTAIIITAYDKVKRKLHFLSVPRHNSGPATHILTLDHTQITSNEMEIMQAQHLNGLILFNSENGFVENNFAFVINPSTRKLFKLPESTIVSSSSYGKKEEVHHICYFFGFNESTNEHKVLKIRMLDIVSINPRQPIKKLCIKSVNHVKPTIEIMIFCMSSLSWRKIDANLPFNVSGNHWYLGTKHSVCVNSVIYVMIEHLNQILAFDLRTEDKFLMINLPSDAIIDEKWYSKEGMNIVTSDLPFLMKINGLLGLICLNRVANHNELDIWILQDDYKNPVWVREAVTYSDSWFLLDGPFLVNRVIWKQRRESKERFPGDVIRVPLYDMETRSMKHVEYLLGHQLLSSSTIRFDHVRSYVESLSPLKSSR
ncbi:putative F-box protein At4g09190 [Rutidosis leptorrhynchoides]|uniref:putative F-box protein At4g09190 n=1 Tax=Rutidosis leptorrhynchoides TaxID=125765 RepID=UPI003A99737A